jgi:predicted nuclease of predicted toxin-antitoxin system
LKLLLDMNLSPDWTDVLREAGHETVHWSTVGRAEAPDEEVLAWAQDRGFVVVTSDLDFSAILAASGAEGPSVLQIRSQALSPRFLREVLLAALRHFESHLREGALVSLDEKRSRARVLPLKRRPR